MKTVKADPTHIYHVFKLLKEYAEDTGLPRPSIQNNEFLISDLLDPQKFFSLIFHGKQAAGMIWGSVSKEKTVTIEGRYLRRKFRNFRFKRELVKETLAAKKNFGKLRLLCPPNKKVGPRFRPIGTIFEEIRHGL